MIMVRFAPMQGNLLSGSIFALFIHRKSLLDTITKLLDADESRVKAPASGSRRRGTLSVPWSKWGPPISMWLDIDRGNSIFWTDPPAGQRWAFLSFTGRNRLTVFDFNPYNIHHAQEDLPGQYAKSRKGDLFSHRNIFAEDIEMGLGCTMYTLPDAYDFHGLLIDEERLMGFKARIFHCMVSHLCLLSTDGRFRNCHEGYCVLFWLTSLTCMCSPPPLISGNIPVFNCHLEIYETSSPYNQFPPLFFDLFKGHVLRYPPFPFALIL